MKWILLAAALAAAIVVLALLTLRKPGSPTPQYAWTHRIGGPLLSRASAICADGNGNIYIAGHFMGECNFAKDWGSSDLKETASYSCDSFITKIDANGKYCWTHRMGGKGMDEAYAICTDGSGNVYVAGKFEKTVNFAKGSGRNDTKTSAGSEDIFITKIDATGNYCWTHRIGGSREDLANAICTDGSANIYIVGRFKSSVNFAEDWGGNERLTSMGGEDIFITKIGTQGKYAWTRIMGGRDDEAARTVCTDQSGNVYVAGSFGLTADTGYVVDFAFDGSGGATKRSAGWSEIFITKIDVNGNHVWTHRMGGSRGDGGTAISTDRNGNVYVAGEFDGILNFAEDWGGSEISRSAGHADIFITKIDARGKYVWTHTIGGPHGDLSTAISTDRNGNIYMTGYFYDTVNFAKSWGGRDAKASAGHSDVFITRININGGYCWTRRIGGSDNDIAWAICTDQGDNIYVAGVFGLCAGPPYKVNFAEDWDRGDTKTRVGFLQNIFITKIEQR